MQHRNLSGRGGFTLAEMLVAMALLAVLAAVVLPSVLGQINKGEVGRVTSDLKNVSHAAKTFYADVQRWPASLSDLGTRPASSAQYLQVGTTNTFGDLVSRWKGPYVERSGTITTLQTGFAAQISGTLYSREWGASGTPRFLVIEVTGLTTDDANRIDLAVDGGTTPDLAAGNIRYAQATATGGAAANVLEFYAAPLGTP